MGERRTPPNEEPKYAKMASFDEFLGEQSIDTLEWLVKAAGTYPIIAKTIDRFHGIETIRHAIKKAGARERFQGGVLDVQSDGLAKRGHAPTRGTVLDKLNEHPIKKGSLEIVTHETTSQNAAQYCPRRRRP